MTLSRYTIVGYALGLMAFVVVVLLCTAFRMAQPLILLVWFASGIAALCAVHFLHPSIRRVGQALAILPLPILGWIDKLPTNRKVDDVLPGLERIRTQLSEWLSNGSGRHIVVTSGDSEDGKSLLAAGLAMSLAGSGMRVTIVDVNFQAPSLHRTFGIPDLPGLAEHLCAPHQVDIVSISYAVSPNLTVIPAGASTLGFGIFELEEFQRLAESLRSASDVVIYDCSAACEGREMLKLPPDETYLIAVVRLQHTSPASLKLLAEKWQQEEAFMRGVVFFGAHELSVAASQAFPQFS